MILKKCYVNYNEHLYMEVLDKNSKSIAIFASALAHEFDTGYHNSIFYKKKILYA